MRTRTDLQALLEMVIGNRNVYFQPPSSIRLQYPCILYDFDYNAIEYADNIPYTHAKRYAITVVTTDPDSDIPDRIADLPTAKFDRSYKSDGLYHTTYTIYY